MVLAAGASEGQAGLGGAGPEISLPWGSWSPLGP